jgi:hypothetical protein
MVLGPHFLQLEKGPFHVCTLEIHVIFQENWDLSLKPCTLSSLVEI